MQAKLQHPQVCKICRENNWTNSAVATAEATCVYSNTAASQQGINKNRNNST